ncbi:NAD-dependent epimerase/dehydratase family protein [Geminicoccus roseus]|uniref:NAD-dependent epimerase/dehydratase family protein n=1 Tax=Geminicoccus roseus TaxID=404900 RepID=UPI00042604A1|nr:NAD(P)-dependent oxidoreductase [Geminicoccus roseus]
MNTILVTGAAGLIGRAVAAQLRARGDRVVGIDRMASGSDETVVMECDLRDSHRLHAIAAATTLDAIIHCGAHSGPMVARDNPYDLVQVNVVGTANVLEVARIHRLRRLVNCSSVSTYGDTGPGPVIEDVPQQPSTVYGATKLAAEKITTAYAVEHGLDTVSLRLSWVYGPNRTTFCILRQMVADALAGRPTRTTSGADALRQYIHAEDAATALVCALDASNLTQRAYNVTGDDCRTMTEAANVVRQILPEADIVLGPGPDLGDDQQQRFDISAARRDLRYTPAISLEQGIRDMAETLRAGRAG